MATQISTLAFKLVADTREFTEGIVATKKELRAAKQIIDETTPAYEKMGMSLQGVDKLFNIGALSAKQHAAAIAQVKKEYLDSFPVAEKSTPLLTGNGVAMSAIGVAATAAAVGIRLMSTAAKELTSNTAAAFSRLDEIGDKAEQLGMSAQSLQKTLLIGELADVSGDTVKGALDKMMVNVGKARGGASKQVSLLDKLGLSAEGLVGKSPDEMLKSISAEIQKIPTEAERLAVISEMFGKANLEMSLLIENYAELHDEVSNGGGLISDEGFANIDDADRAIKQLRQEFEGIFNVIAADISPEIKIVADTLRGLFDGDGLTVGITTTLDLMRGIVETTGEWIAELEKAMPLTMLVARMLATSANAGAGVTGISEVLGANRREIELDRQLKNSPINIAEQERKQAIKNEAQMARKLAEDEAEGPSKKELKAEQEALKAETKAAHEAEREEAALLKKEMAARKKLANDAAKDRNDVLRDIERAEDHQLIELGMRTKGQVAARDALRKGASQQEADLLMGLTDSKSSKPMDVRNEAISFGSAGAAEAIAKSRAQETNQQEELVKGLKALTAMMGRFAETGGIRLELEVEEVDGF